MSESRKTKFIRREWLNAPDSPSTGNVVAYDGELVDYDNEPYHSMYLCVSDCHVSAKLHRAYYDTDQEFINKMKSIRDVLNDFIAHLESEYSN